MIWQFDVIVLSLIVLCALFTISIKDLLGAAIMFGTYSFLMCLLWTEMSAVDVAFTEATVGAGVSTILFIAVVHRSSRRVKPRRRGRLFYKGVGLSGAALLGGVLFYASTDLPAWGDPQSPAASHVSPYYLTQTLADTAVPNAVTSILADYRSFDTMFETAVILTAGLAVLIILQLGGHRREVPVRQQAGHIAQGYEDNIIRLISRIMIPFLQLFALYVIAHGHYSPGGGFQGGVILGATFILLAISYDLKLVVQTFSEKTALVLANTGILIYAGTGALCLALGANFLDYSALAPLIPGATSVTARSHAILAVEIGVALTVMASIVIIYTNLVSDGTYEKGL